MANLGHIESSHPTHRITRLADSVDLPAHRRRFRTGAQATGPELIAGRGLDRRHPRSSLSILLWGAAYLLVGTAIAILVSWFLLA